MKKKARRLRSAERIKRTYSVSEAREHFAAVLARVEQGEDVEITKHGKTIGTFTPHVAARKKPAIPPPGYLQAQGWSVKMTDDFDAIPEGFEDYV